MITQKIAVFGADSNIGTTMISMGICEILSSSLGEEGVLYIDCSEKAYEGYTGLPFNKTRGIDMIFRVVDPIQAAYEVGDYKVIPGPRSRTQLSYDEDFLEKVFEGSGDDIKRVIIDAGSDPRSALCQQALKTADKRIFVIRQNPKCIDKFEMAYDNIFKSLDLVDDTKDIIIINALRKTSLLLSEKDMMGKLLRNFYTLPFIRDGIKTEYRRCTLTQKSARFKKALKKIVLKEL